jgi:LysM repeat protein
MRKLIKTLIVSVAIFGNVFCMSASQDNEAYIQKYCNIAMREMNDYGIPASITLAQGILESAAGTSRLAVQANNHFGIKCHNDWSGEKIYHDDDKRNECFRKYERAEESFIDHSQFLKDRPRYSFLFELDKTDYKAWAKGLKQAGYATDPNYPNRLITLIEKYELYKYDKESFTSKEEGVKTPAKTVKEKNESGLKYVYVQKGESYYTIAVKYNIPFGLIYSYNDVDRKTRQPEEGTVVYLQKKKKKITWGEGVHVVEKGESMHDISQKYGIRLHSLYDLNNMSYESKPEVGQLLKLR